MTQYEIRLLLHYFVSPTEPEGDEPIRDATKAQFIHLGLLKELRVPNSYGCNVAATPMLDRYVQALMDVPLPVQKWVMPNETDR